MAPGLHLVATPIGNLGDLSSRAVATLGAVELIACEDTRVSAKLLGRFSIATKRLAYHDHNAAELRPMLLERLTGGAAIALISDAGTPLVSDPGYKLVRDCIERAVPVHVVPGPSAPLAALLLSGLPPDRFLFAGFLPPRTAARRRELATLKDVPATLVFFEAPRRLAGCLDDLAAMLGDRPAAVARELTKLFEEVVRGPLSTLADRYREAGPPKGEIVIVVGPPDHKAETAAAEPSLDRSLAAALATLSVRDAADHVAVELGLQRRAVYQRALALSRQGAP